MTQYIQIRQISGGWFHAIPRNHLCHIFSAERYVRLFDEFVKLRENSRPHGCFCYLVREVMRQGSPRKASESALPWRQADIAK
jgi:hypothetical protein